MDFQTSEDQLYSHIRGGFCLFISLSFFRRITSVLFFIIIIFLISPICVNPGTGVDSLGNRITVPEGKIRIVSLSPGATETLYLLGLRDEIVGVSDFCNYPPEFVETKPTMGGYSTPNVEKIRSVSPHVVILTTVVPLYLKDQFDKLGIPIFVSVPKSFNDLLVSIEQYGKLFGREKYAYALIEKLMADVGEVTKAVRRGSIKPVRTFIEIFDNPLYAAGRNTLPGDIVTMAGGEVVPDTQEEYPRLSEENLIILNPEAIILGHNTDLSNFIETRKSLAGINALRNRKIFVPDPDEFLRPCPRVVNALRDIARFLHPEAFQ
ncbi:MAG: ABC transporter substrate-binding protein [Spirochaetota bacterium]